MHQKYKVKRGGGRVIVEVLLADRDKDARAPFAPVGQLNLTESQWAALKRDLPTNAIIEDLP